MSSTTACKFHIKLGSAEFSGEGSEDIVKEQLGHFYIAITQPPPARIIPNGHGQNGNGTVHVNGNGIGAAHVNGSSNYRSIASRCTGS